MGPDDIIRSPHAKAPLRALPAAPPSPLLDIKTNVRPIPASYPPHDPSLGRLLPKHLLSGEAVWGLPWGHKSGPQLFVGIGTIAND